MSKYLVHYFMNGIPVGIWDSKGKNFYIDKKAKKYGKSVLSEANFKNWDDLLDVWDGKTPNGIARWGTYETDAESLEAAFTFLADESER